MNLTKAHDAPSIDISAAMASVVLHSYLTYSQNMEAFQVSQISSGLIMSVYASVFLSAVFGGAGFVFMKNALVVFPSPWFVFWRFFLSVVVLFPFLAAGLRKASRQTLKDGVFVGILFFTATLVQLQGIARTDAGRSAFINSTAVVIIPILQAFIVRRMPSWKVICGCLLCLCGVGFLTLQRTTGHVDGNAEFLVFAGTCIFSYQSITFRRFAQRGNPNILTFIQFTTISLLALPIALTFPHPVVVGSGGWSGILYAAIMMNIAMVMVSNNALRYISPTSLAVIGSMQAVYGALFGALMLSEPITWQLVLSGSIILSGILISILSAVPSRSI